MNLPKKQLYMSSTKKQKFEYSGKLEEYQLYKKNTYTKYEADQYSQYQNFLYKRALYGLKSLPTEEVEKMSKQKKIRISKVHRRAQRVLNQAKQRKVITITNEIFAKWFPDTKFTKFMLGNTETDEKVRNTLNFKDLNMHKDEIIRIFIEEGILSSNFLNLTRDPNSLPRLKSV
tara:strand:- start:337 stop:858 length:522 start_codon:yes stop_codon:yes gene_type:complete